MTQAITLKPNDTVRVKYDTGEYYADYPSHMILVASLGSKGRVVSIDEFRKDFIRRLRQTKFNRDHQQAYKAHFAVVAQAMEQGLQYPVRFEKVTQPVSPVDIVRASPDTIELVDGAALEKVGTGSLLERVGTGSLLDQVANFFMDPSPAKPVSSDEFAQVATNGFRDQAKFIDPELATMMAHDGPLTQAEIETVYLRHTSILSYHNLWYRLKKVVAEAAYDIIDSLHYPKRKHSGYSWEIVADMLEKNDPKKPLWYTLDQQEALVEAAQNIYQMEQEHGYEAMANYTNPDLLQQLENNPDISPDLADEQNDP